MYSISYSIPRVNINLSNITVNMCQAHFTRQVKFKDNYANMTLNVQTKCFYVQTMSRQKNCLDVINSYVVYGYRGCLYSLDKRAIKY